jgi:SAM-dependent methyltransferase
MAQRPEPFAAGASFWTDPRLGQQLLAAHLDAATDAASRRSVTIASEVDWLVGAFELKPGSRVLDLGCGPGLYCAALADHGLAVTGMDVSPIALEHARRAAAESGREIRYIEADYLELDAVESYDAAVLVYLDFGVLPSSAHLPLLRRIYAALRPEGRVAFDVVSDAARREERTSWSAHTSGFWRPSPHLVLERQLDYPELDLSCREHVVLEPHTEATVYRFWEHRFSRERLEHLLDHAGFQVELFAADLTGAPWTPTVESMAVVAGKQPSTSNS